MGSQISARRSYRLFMGIPDKAYSLTEAARLRKFCSSLYAIGGELKLPKDILDKLEAASAGHRFKAIKHPYRRGGK